MTLKINIKSGYTEWESPEPINPTPLPVNAELEAKLKEARQSADDLIDKIKRMK